MWVPLIENNEHNSEGADYFVRKHLGNIFSKSAHIDTILLACTHYPLLKDKIARFLPPGVKLLVQGEIIARSLSDYLHRHPEIESRCTRNGYNSFYTTDSVEEFNNHASIFYGHQITASHAELV
jgi:glutamate racemase